MVVVIAIVLAIAIPGLSAMTSDARFSSAVQMVNGALTRAQVEALGDNSMTAVRFVPGQWDAQTAGAAPADQGRQHAVSFRYTFSSADPNDLSKVTFSQAERFERRPDTPSIELPAEIWAAPVEALATTDADGNGVADGREVLTGQIGRFVRQPPPGGNVFLPADDFLIVFDNRTGLVGRGAPASPARFRLLTYNADASDGFYRQDDPGVLRFNYSGVVFYRREPFAALGASAAAADRQALLQRLGRPYYVHRFGGGLVMGVP